MTSSRLGFIDWLKCIGMLLIVLGHTSAQNLFDPTPPVNFKQLGVAFFVFVMGVSLARELRGVGQVLWNRLFDVYFIGGCVAVLLSLITWFVRRDLNESNYLPLALGINVVFNYFPANPTTWYIGTYLHLLLFWAIALRHLRVCLWMIIGCVLLEIPIRAVLLYVARDFVAYMALANWTSLLLFGLYVGQQNDITSNEKKGRYFSLLLEVGALMTMLLLWRPLVETFGIWDGFPFDRIAPGSQEVVSLLGTSTAVSMLYLTYTWLSYRVCLHLPESGVVTFFATNSLLTFIIHMPMVYLLTPLIYPRVPSGTLRVCLDIGLFFVLPGIVSGILRRLAPPSQLRMHLAALISSRIPSHAAVKGD